MTQPAAVNPSDIRDFQAENPKLRARDAADAMGISEAALVAASIGHGTTRIDAHPDRIIPAAERLGEVMALTRVGACVHEKVGEYGAYHPGEHAAMTLAEDIDLRIFPVHWAHAFAVETSFRAWPAPVVADLRCGGRCGAQDPPARGVEPRRMGRYRR